MATLAKVLKDEIARVANREINKALKPVKSIQANQRRYIAELRRRIDALEREKKQLVRTVEKTAAAVPDVDIPDETQRRAWITAQGVRSLRKRLKVTQQDFARLAGVSVPTVTNWEGQETGKLSIRRRQTLERLQEMKAMGIRQARAQLDS